MRHGIQLGVWIILLAGLTACGTLGSGESPAEGAAVPILAQPSNAPEDVVTTFLTGWKNQDYATMYNQVSQPSKDATGLGVFEEIYRTTATAISLADVAFTIQDSSIQGYTAAVTYDVILESPVFGTIADNGRIMRLIQEASGWRIAWSSMDIFDGLASGAELRVISRREARGNIYDRSGQVMVEENGTVVSLYAAQEKMSSVDDCLDLLGGVMMRQRRDLEALFNQNNFDTIFYVGDIDLDTDARRGQELDDTCGIIRFQYPIRRYAGHGGAAHITGYVAQIPAEDVALWRSRGYSETDLIGQTGIEQQYESELSGEAERVLRIIAPGGIILRELAGRPGKAPQSVSLTIDWNLQQIVAQALADAFNYAEPNWAGPGISPGAGAVVLDANTGEILALASYPFYDPGVFHPDSAQPNRGAFISDLISSTRQPLLDRAIQEQYFPGSTFKIVSTAAAAGEGLFGTDDIFYCGLEWDGRAEFGDTFSPRSDWRKTDGLDATGDINISQALTSSCDPFYYEVGAELFTQKGANALISYAQRLGLGTAVGLGSGFPEAPGNLATPNSVEAAINNAIGQGEVQLPLLQMARMVAAVANGGTVYQPYIVQQVGGLDGADMTFSAQPRVQQESGLSPAIIEIIHDGMCGVTTDPDRGTAEFVFGDTSYSVCGKTGTAQSGAVAPHGWFVAFAPADDPQIAVVVMVEFSREGSETAAPIVRRILDGYFNAPVADFPQWWNNLEYIPLEIPEGGTGG
jgi:penicillin-binding protein 2